MSTIIFRYLNREVLMAMIAVALVLMVVIVTSRVSRYLTNASEGILNSDVLFLLIQYRLPEFLQLILPLSLFLGILLGFGRLYVDNEITVLLACGVSIGQIASRVLMSAVVVAGVVGVLSLWLTPLSLSKFDHLWSAQGGGGGGTMEFESLVPGRFQAQANNTRTIYTETLSKDKRQLGNIFIAQTNNQLNQSSIENAQNVDESVIVIVAETATQTLKPETNDRFIVLNNGYRYDGKPGKLDYREMQFSSYGVKIEAGASESGGADRSSKSTVELWSSSELKDNAELQWRISLPLLVPIVALLAIPLSRVKPRQGRFVKLLPAFFIYMSYVFLLISARSALGKQQIPVSLGLWGVHFIFIGLTIMLFKFERLLLWWHQVRTTKAVSV